MPFGFLPARARFSLSLIESHCSVRMLLFGVVRSPARPLDDHEDFINLPPAGGFSFRQPYESRYDRRL